MAGHSKWKNIAVRKGAQDAKKAKYFTKAAKEIIISARMGGGEPEHNARLRSAIAAARAVNLPKDKIETAIKKGTGELEGGDIQEVIYEGYGPGGVAILVEAATDNRNRTVAEVRHLFSKGGGNMGESGCVNWMFQRKGILTFDREKYTEDQLLEVGLEGGAEDVSDEGSVWEVYCAPEDFDTVQQAFEDAGMEWESADVSMVPENLSEVDVETGRKVVRLLDNLEDNDDVQKVHSNADFPDELMAEMDG